MSETNDSGEGGFFDEIAEGAGHVVDSVGQVFDGMGQDIVDGVTLITEQARDGAEWVVDTAIDGVEWIADKVGLGDDEAQ